MPNYPYGPIFACSAANLVFMKSSGLVLNAEVSHTPGFHSCGCTKLAFSTFDPTSKEVKCKPYFIYMFPFSFQSWLSLTFILFFKMWASFKCRDPGLPYQIWFPVWWWGEWKIVVVYCTFWIVFITVLLEPLKKTPPKCHERFLKKICRE